MKKYKLLLVVFAFVIFCLSVALLMEQKMPTLPGTYSGIYDGSFAYLILRQTGEYRLYYPQADSPTIDTGLWSHRENELFRLDSDRTGSGYLIREKDGLYLITAIGEVSFFEKQTDDIFTVNISDE